MNATATNWKEQAIRAAKQRAEQAERERRESEERDRQHQARELKWRLNNVGVEAEPESGEVEVDGVRFKLHEEHYETGVMGYQSRTSLRADMPEPGGPFRLASYDLHTAADLGEFLNGHYRRRYDATAGADDDSEY